MIIYSIYSIYKIVDFIKFPELGGIELSHNMKQWIQQINPNKFLSEKLSISAPVRYDHLMCTSKCKAWLNRLYTTSQPFPCLGHTSVPPSLLDALQYVHASLIMRSPELTQRFRCGLTSAKGEGMAHLL